MKRDNIQTNDRQLACARISSTEGQDYLKAMSAAANFAWVNRSSMTFLCRQVFQDHELACLSFKKINIIMYFQPQAFAKQFNSTPDDLDMHLIYDVSHNIAKVEQHMVDGKLKTLLVHRKVFIFCEMLNKYIIQNLIILNYRVRLEHFLLIIR